MYAGKIKNKKLRKKAEEILQKQFNPKLNHYNDDQYLYELRVSLIELEIQNSELIKTQLKFEDSNDKYFDRYKLAPVGYFILDKKGFILESNYEGSKLLGSEINKLDKKAFIEYVHPDHRNNFHQHYISALRARNKQSIDLKLRNIDDNYFYARLESISLLDQKGNFQELIIIVTNIDELKKSERHFKKSEESYIDKHKKDKIKLEKLIKKLKISNKELEQFAYISSHDLKEPLRTIINFLLLLQKKYENNLNEDVNEYIEYAIDASKRLNMMIDDLLEYSRIGSKDRKLKHLSTKKILETVLINLKTLIENNNANITYGSLPIIYANEQQMVQLFQNLISNAIKYRGKKDPRINISAKQVNKKFIFIVEDNGIGIDKKNLDKIFTIFKRLQTWTEYEGTGIGLSISKKIIHQYGGKIWAESELDKGTKFYFTLPIKN